MKKRILSTLLGLSLIFSTLTGCGNSNSESTVDDAEATIEVSEEISETNSSEENSEVLDSSDDFVIRIGALSGPTAMGMVKLMDDAENGKTKENYEFAELSTDASAFVAPLSTGEIDIAAIPSNLASNVYNKTEGKIQILATNTLGVLYLLERGETVKEWADLKGATIYATGAGAVPEYTIRYILTSNNLDPDKDVNIQWCADTTEALSYVSQSEGAIAILPQPFVTAAKAQVEDLRVVFDLNSEWDKLNTGCNIVTGVVVARTDFINEHPDAVATFLKEYEASVKYTVDNPEEASLLVEKYGIVAKAPIAKAAIPNCHITFKTGKDMKTAVSGFLEILYNQNPQSVGGALPEDDFYYGAN